MVTIEHDAARRPIRHYERSPSQGDAMVRSAGLHVVPEVPKAVFNGIDDLVTSSQTKAG
jgi:hypothetical protein